MIEPPSAPSRAASRSAWSHGEGTSVARDLLADPHPVDPQQLARPVVRLDQHADRPLSGAPRRRADAALELVADHARPAADVALGDRPVGRRRERRVQVLGVDVEAVDVVERAVVRLADHRQRPDRVAHAVGPRGRLDQRVAHHPDAVRVRDADRPAQHPGLPDPLEPGELAVAVEPMRPGEDRLGPDVAVVRDDGGDAGADRSRARPQRAVARDERRVPDADAGDVGDRVERPRLHATDADPELTSAHRRSVATARSGLRGWPVDRSPSAFESRG